MNKTPHERNLERYNEIKKEIWQISESFTMITKGKSVEDLTNAERRHIEILHLNLRELICELNSMSLFRMSIIYKKLVNNLICDLGKFTSQEYFQEVRENIGFVNLRLE